MASAQSPAPSPLHRPVSDDAPKLGKIRHGTPYAPQVERGHYFEDYDSDVRWSSYWIQIEEALRIDGPLLEVGMGSGLVSAYLRQFAGKLVTTVDIDPHLRPDVVADIVDLPFEDASFACVMACEVLEHLPFDRVGRALAELRRVGRSAIVSVPDSGFCLQLRATARGRSGVVRVELPWLFRRRTPRGASEHFWELNIEGYPGSRLQTAIHDAGWRVSREMRNPAYTYHHFFILE